MAILRTSAVYKIDNRAHRCLSVLPAAVRPSLRSLFLRVGIGPRQPQVQLSLSSCRTRMCRKLRPGGRGALRDGARDIDKRRSDFRRRRSSVRRSWNVYKWIRGGWRMRDDKWRKRGLRSRSRGRKGSSWGRRETLVLLKRIRRRRCAKRNFRECAQVRERRAGRGDWRRVGRRGRRQSGIFDLTNWKRVSHERWGQVGFEGSCTYGSGERKLGPRGFRMPGGGWLEWMAMSVPDPNEGERPRVCEVLTVSRGDNSPIVAISSSLAKHARGFSEGKSRGKGKWGTYRIAVLVLERGAPMAQRSRNERDLAHLSTGGYPCVGNAASTRATLLIERTRPGWVPTGGRRGFMRVNEPPPPHPALLRKVLDP